MRFHCNASTNIKQRLYIRKSPLGVRALARQLGIAASTVLRWKHRDSPLDRSSRPKRMRCALDLESQELALGLRQRGQSLDVCWDALGGASRSSVYRHLVRHGLGRLRAPKLKVGVFKVYEPGFVHIDHFYLPPLQGTKRYCFVAIDRATRLAFLRVYDDKTKTSACDFLERALNFFPFRVHKILTDNGPEFTNQRYKRVPQGAKAPHPFEAICKDKGIQRRLTAPYTPQTNGMAERLVGLAKNATVNATIYSSHAHIEHHLKQWLTFYNQARKHSGIQRSTPQQQTMKWYNQKPELFTRKPDGVFLTY